MFKYVKFHFLLSLMVRTSYMDAPFGGPLITQRIVNHMASYPIDVMIHSYCHESDNKLETKASNMTKTCRPRTKVMW